MEKPSGSAAVGAKAQVEKQARQLAYDTRYKVKSELKAKSAGGKVDPAAVSKLYMAQLAKSTAAPPVKQRAKEMLMGEDYVDTRRLVVDSAASALYKVFVEGIDEKVEEIEEEKGDKTYKVRVTDKDSGKSYVRMASREKIAELRSNPNIASVEMTQYGEPTRSETAGKKAKKDYDGDGKIESGSKEHAGVVHNAIQRSKGGKADGKDTRKEGYSWKDGFAELIEKKDEEEKKITGEGVNNKKLIKVFPDDVKEQMEGETEDPSMKSKLKKANMAKKQVLMKKLQAVRMGAGDDIQASNELEGEVELDENRRAARAAGGYKDDSKKQPDPSKKGFTGIGNMSIDQIRKMSARIEKEKTQKEEVEQIDEADSLAAMAARREKRLAAQRKREGTTGAGHDFGHDHGISDAERKKRQQKEFDAFIGRGKKTTKEEVEGVDEAMRPGPRREKMRAKMHDPYVRGGSKSRGQAHNIAVRGDVSTADPAIKSRGGGGVEKDKGMGYGDRGAGNKARRRAGQEPMRGNTRTEEVEMKKDQKSDGRDTPTKVKLALARLRAKGMKVASPIVAPSNRDTAELPPLGEGINAYPASLRARTMGMSKADRQKHFDAYDAKKKGEEKKVSEGVVKKDYIGPLYAAWQDVIAGNSNTAAKFEEGIGIDQQMKISQDYNRMSPEEKLAANKKAMGNVKKVAPKKDTRTDAEKMTDAVGKPRMGSSD